MEEEQMTRHPFDEYLDALDEFNSGNTENSALLFSHALGGGKKSKVIEYSLPRFFQRGTFLHDSILKTLDAERRKRLYG